MSTRKVKSPRWIRVGKRFLPTLARLITVTRLGQKIDIVQAYMAMARGLGCGGNLSLETVCATSLVHSNEPVLWDVGANQGLWSEMMQMHYKGKARIFLIEPAQFCLSRIAERNIIGSTCLPFAVGACEGKCELHSSHPGDTTASLYARRDTEFYGRDYCVQVVQTRQIDNLMKEQGVTKVDFLKMDIEGHELSALRGATEALAAGCIMALSFEFGSANKNSRTFFQDYWDFLTSYNFLLYRMLPSGALERIEHYREELEYFRRYSTYFASLG